MLKYSSYLEVWTMDEVNIPSGPKGRILFAIFEQIKIPT
jgi:hypothetical protein